MTTKLSVIMTNFNHAQYIAEALGAIVNQSFKPFEIFVCDDGSTDNSIEVIQRYVDQYSFVHLIRNDTNLGIFASHNKLIPLVSGDYLYSAAADDRILPGFFEKSMILLQQNPKAGLCSALSFIIDENGRKKGISLTPIVARRASFLTPEKVKEVFLRNGSWIFGITTILKIDYFIKVGGYCHKLYSFCDGFIQELLALQYGACFIPEPLTCWRRLLSNYSITTGNNPEIYKKLIENSASLMRTGYPDIFPEKYVKEWQNQHYFYLAHNINKKKDLFLPKKVLISCYLFLIFKRNPWRTCYNRIRCSFIKWLYEYKEKLSEEKYEN